MIYKGNKPLILSTFGKNGTLRRMYRGNNPIYASEPQFFPLASGGTIYYNGDYAIHVIISNQSFTPAVRGNYEVFLVGEGGQGGNGNVSGLGGGGGAGGTITLSTQQLFSQGYGVIVGGTGSGPATSFGGILSSPGGEDGDIDGDGYGGDYISQITTEPNYDGGLPTGNNGGGGAGAGANGENGSDGITPGSDGGAGYFLDWLDGVDVSAQLGPNWNNFFAAGGGGSGANGGTGGSSIGGNGSTSGNGGDADDYTGSGGGGAVNSSYSGGAGSSGICLVRYRYKY